MGWIKRKVYDVAARTLVKPRGRYNLLYPTNLEALRRTLRKGDVVLVDGEQRVSEVIKYLTQSTWSHSMLYVGDELVRRQPARRADLYSELGTDAEHVVLEALMETGVTASPLAKYSRHNVRICRPIGLRRDDLQRVLDEVLEQMGQRYDVQHIVDLARYFFPVTLIPRRLRRRAVDLGGGLTSEVICSSLIARAFQNVGFPILPAMTPDAGPRATSRWADWVRRTRRPYAALFHRQAPSLITPRDFDLSPYFEVVKVNAVEDSRFDYRRIRWA